MTETPTHAVNQLLAQLAAGERVAADRLFDIVYEELRALAGSYFKRQSLDHTLQPTALVHEAFLRLVQTENLGAKDREHFFALAARVMRNVLVDYARTKSRAKRGGSWTRVTFRDELAGAKDCDLDMLALDEAMSQLADLNAQMSRLVELRFFGGLTCEEAAGLLGISRATADRDWRFARAWLLNELRDEESA